MDPLVSIVVPAFNEAGHIRECLGSILAQSYRNWECIVANNCSTDGTGEIAHEYEVEDQRITVYDNNKFLPAIVNFNQALKKISPEAKYCKMVFADDWIFPDCLEKMVDVAERYPSTAIVSAYALKGRKVICSGLPYNQSFVSGREVCRNRILKNESLFGSPTSILYRADLVRTSKPFFNEANIHCDSEKCCELLRTFDFGFVHQILTYERVREGSMSSFSERMGTSLAEALRELVVYGPECLTTTEYELCLDRMLRTYYRCLARGLVHRLGAPYRNYHRKALLGAGVGFEWKRLGKAFVAETIHALSNPGITITALTRRARSDDWSSRVDREEEADRGLNAQLWSDGNKKI